MFILVNGHDVRAAGLGRGGAMTAAGRWVSGAGSAGVSLSAERLLQHSGLALAQLYRGGPEWTVERGDGWWLVLSGSGDAAHNWVAIADPGAAGLIPELVARVRLAGVPAMLATTQEVMVAAGESLHRAALDLAVASPHLGASLDDLDLSPRPCGAVISPASDEEGLASATVVLADAFGFDLATLRQAVTPVVLFGRSTRITTATVAGQAVAATVVWTADAITYVCFAGTVPAMQGRGYGRAVLVAALRREQQRGARAVHLMASADGEPLYRRLGMREVGFGPLLLHAIPLAAGPGLKSSG